MSSAKDKPLCLGRTVLTKLCDFRIIMHQGTGAHEMMHIKETLAFINQKDLASVWSHLGALIGSCNAYRAYNNITVSVGNQI